MKNIVDLESLSSHGRIRIEDTIAVTETGYEDLSLGVPRTVVDIEALKKNDGLLQTAGDARTKRGKK